MAQPDAFEERLCKRQLLTFRWTDTLRATSLSIFSQEDAERMLQAIDHSVEMAQDGKHLCGKAIDSKVLESLSGMKNMQDLAVAGRRRSEQVAGCLAEIDGNTVPQELVSAGVMESVNWWRMVETNTSMVVRLMSSLPDVQGQKAVKTKKGFIQQWKDTKPQWKETMSQWESLSSTLDEIRRTFTSIPAHQRSLPPRYTTGSIFGHPSESQTAIPSIPMRRVQSPGIALEQERTKDNPARCCKCIIM